QAKRAEAYRQLLLLITCHSDPSAAAPAARPGRNLLACRQRPNVSRRERLLAQPLKVTSAPCKVHNSTQDSAPERIRNEKGAPSFSRSLREGGAFDFLIIAIPHGRSAQNDPPHPSPGGAADNSPELAMSLSKGH